MEINFGEEEIKKLKIGGCVEKTIDGERILVCGGHDSERPEDD